MRKPLMRIPYTGPLPPPSIIPRYANTPAGARQALTRFLNAPQAYKGEQPSPGHDPSKTVLLTGAGISVASGLADYCGTRGTYTLNKTYLQNDPASLAQQRHLELADQAIDRAFQGFKCRFLILYQPSKSLVCSEHLFS